MKVVRALSSCFIVLALVVGSMTMAVARSQPRAVGEMVLCTGRGMVTVDVDAQGRPTGPNLHCPDCVIILNALPAGDVAVATAAGRLVALVQDPGDHVAPVLRSSVDNRSRAPPVPV